MSLDAVIDKLFGVKTRAVVNPRAVKTATATAQLILSNNPNRLAWTIVNLGDKVCYIELENDVGATKGVRLDANGGSASELYGEDFHEVGWAVWIISVGGDSAVYSKEVVIY